MYEIWLALNILFELALMYLPLVVVVAVAIVVLWGAALAKGAPLWRQGGRTAVSVGLAVTAVAMLVVPALTESSLGELRYWVDWANLFAIAAGFGTVAAALALPLTAIARGRGAGGESAPAASMSGRPAA